MNLQNLYFFHYNFSEGEMEATAIFTELAETILSCYKEAWFPPETAIYLFTPDAGVYHSVRLWENALEHGPDFANPGNFPWTLASCPASFLARSLKAHGPNLTLIGGTGNLPQIQESVHLHATQDLIEVAIVAHLQNNFNDLIPTAGFCKGVVISLSGDTIINFEADGIKQFFL